MLIQESIPTDRERCFAVYAREGGSVVVPPDWAHATVGRRHERLTFSAWYEHDCGYQYQGVWSLDKLAWYPALSIGGELRWERNPTYSNSKSEITKTCPTAYSELGIRQDEPIYTQFQRDQRPFDFASKPRQLLSVWDAFKP